MHNRIKLSMLPVFAFLLCTGAAFAQKTPPPPAVQPPPPPAPSRITDFEDARKQLEKAAAELEQTVRNFTPPEPPEPPTPPEIDTAEISRAMKEMDAAKIRADVALSLQEVNLEKIKNQMDSALAKIDMAAMRKEMEVQMQKIKADLAKQNEAYAKVKEQLKAMKPNLEAQIERAKADIAKAKEELDAYETFVNSLRADGLLDTKAYTIEHKGGKLYINGKEQPEAVYNKHRSFLEKQKDLKITKDENGLNIRKD